MAVPAGCYHVRFGGALPSGEVWESGFWVDGAAPATNVLANATAQLWFAQLTAADSSGAVRLTWGFIAGVGTTMTYVKIYSYPTGGTEATAIGTYSGTSPTPGTLVTMPNQCALVVSLRSNAAGRRGRGRMYLPCNNVALATSGQIAGGTITGIATAWATCFNDWNASGDNGVVSVVSQVGAGESNPVSEIIVDSIVDTQRRRRNKVVATSTAVDTVTS